MAQTERKTDTFVVTMVRPASAGGDREVSVRVPRTGNRDAAERAARVRAAQKWYGRTAVWYHDSQYPQRGQIMVPAGGGSGAGLNACTPVVVLHVGAYGIARS